MGRGKFDMNNLIRVVRSHHIEHTRLHTLFLPANYFTLTFAKIELLNSLTLWRKENWFNMGIEVYTGDLRLFSGMVLGAAPNRGVHGSEWEGHLNEGGLPPRLRDARCCYLRAAPNSYLGPGTGVRNLRYSCHE